LLERKKGGLERVGSDELVIIIKKRGVPIEDSNSI